MTTDHDEIKKWAEARKGTPSRVIGTEHGKDDAGLIRLDFPGYSGEGKLGLLIQEKTADGKTSHFNKLIKREDHK